MRVLLPAHVDADSGYRYYSAGQMLEAERVRQLRSLDMPLDEVRAILRDRDPMSIRQRLDDHRRRLAKRLDETEGALRFVETLMTQEKMMNYEVNTKTTVEQPIIKRRARASLQSIGSTIHEAIGELYEYIGHIGARPMGPPGTIYLDDDLDKEEDLQIEIFVPVERSVSGNDRLDGDVLAGGSVAYTLHAGPFHEVGPAYPAVAKWVRENGYGLAGPPREVYLAKGETPEENRAEVQWPVAGKST